MKKALFVCLLSIGLFSCNNNKNSVVEGTYYGTLPCADCPGINYELELKKDSTYNEKMLYLERDVPIVETRGNFKIENDTVLQLQTPKGENGSQFSIKTDSLMMLDGSGKTINFRFSEKYHLTKEKPEGFTMENKRQNNPFDFKATGNEPFWILTIDFDKTMHFKHWQIKILNFECQSPML